MLREDNRPPREFKNKAEPILKEPICRSTIARMGRYSFNAAAARDPTGTYRSLLPFPITRTHPLFRSRSCVFRDVSSPMRSPDEYSNSNIARSRFCRSVFREKKRSTSSTLSAFGKGFSRFGALMDPAGLVGIISSRINSRKKVRMAASFRPMDTLLILLNRLARKART